MFDPWIEGPAVFGSWITYPPSNIRVEDLPKIHGIFISHEHSDHFHEFTLKKFDKHIPIFVPDFIKTCECIFVFSPIFTL